MNTISTIKPRWGKRKKRLLAAIATFTVLLLPAMAMSQGQASGGPAGTSGADPGASSPASGTAGTPGTTPSSQTLNNPLNRNPANRKVTTPDVAPAPDDSNSSSRPTLGAVTSPDNRDTVVTPDPSRDSTSNPVANPPR